MVTFFFSPCPRLRASGRHTLAPFQIACRPACTHLLLACSTSSEFDYTAWAHVRSTRGSDQRSEPRVESSDHALDSRV